jgi:type I restriction enzyme S subunit
MTQGGLKAVRTSIPPLAEQKAIAAVLGTLDDKIELNRRMNATLEAMARALFQSWFVDFDPVRAKLDGRKTDGLDKATASLFPNRFEHVSDTLVPKGWKLTNLGDHVDLQRGNTYKSKLKDMPGPYLLGLGSINRNGGFRDDSLRTYGGDSPPKLILRPGDLFVSLKDVTQAADLLGAVARVPPEVLMGRLTQDTVKLVGKQTGLSFNYLYWALRHPQYRAYCRSHATGTTNLGLSREDFFSFPVIVPSADVQDLFDTVAGQVDSLIDKNRQTSKTLATLRDTLLPKLLSGEIAPEHAKRTTEASA